MKNFLLLLSFALCLLAAFIAGHKTGYDDGLKDGNKPVVQVERNAP